MTEQQLKIQLSMILDPKLEVHIDEDGTFGRPYFVKKIAAFIQENYIPKDNDREKLEACPGYCDVCHRHCQFENTEDMITWTTCDKCKHYTSMHNDQKGCLAEGCFCGIYDDAE